MKLEKTVAFVTGANRGLGEEFVCQLLKAGVGKVYAAAREPEKLSALVASDKSRVIPIRLDITDPEQVRAAAKKASEVQLLINNAGVLSFGGALDVADDAITRDMSVNFHGLLNMTRAFAPVIKGNGGGTVANVLTLLSFVSVPGWSAYNASKAAAWSMAMSLRPYLAQQNIAVVNAFPAGIDTDMLKGVEGPKDSPSKVAEDILAAIRSGTEDVYPGSAAAVFESWRRDQKAVEKMFAGMM